MKTKNHNSVSLLRRWDKPTNDAPNKAQHSPWALHRLDDHWNGEKRWSAGVNGPRVYLTCDEETAKLIVRAVNHADKLAEALRDVVKQCGTEQLGDNLWLDIKRKLAAYENAN